MARTGIATFGLDYGRCPPWLFARMKRLGRLITEAIVLEYGNKEFVRRMSDPFFFQSFGTILAFDWDASGLTTTTTGALKEALRGTERTLGIFVAGGKGKTSLKTPDDITRYADWHGFNPNPLVYASKMSAKVDNTAVQDGFTLYHHSFIFTKDGLWTVVQQGMDTARQRARRYHWLSDKLTDFVEEPHSGIKDTKLSTRSSKVLNLVAKKSRKTRDTSATLVKEEFPTLLKDLKVLDYVNFPFDRRRMEKSLSFAHDSQPENFEQLLGVRGVGPKTIRALSLVSEVIYGAKPSYTDPARYSYAHGGKDGIPYPVDRSTYDTSISVLERAVKKARLGYYERLKALQKLV
ncbi:DUF763 domain-containing protein [Candidatus Microgenomates bacterium]|nr:DUF763 domain-containing protein [Candidatus Microgenomates bacterium]